MRYSPIKILFLSAGMLVSAACQRHWQPKPQLTQTALVISDKQTTDDVAEKTIAPYRQQVTSKMGEVIGFAPSALEKAPVESPLGNFVADLQRSQAQKLSGKPVDLGVMTNGGLRTLIPKGNIKVGDIFELMPFENELVIVTVNGATVQQLFNYAAAKQTASIANSTYSIKAGQPVNIMIGGKPLDVAKNYTVALSDYLANTGDQMDFMTNKLAMDKVGMTVRDAILTTIREQTALQKPIEAKVEGRVTVLP